MRAEPGRWDSLLLHADDDRRQEEVDDEEPTRPHTHTHAHFFTTKESNPVKQKMPDKFHAQIVYPRGQPLEPF
jgi:hypothetical protein